MSGTDETKTTIPPTRDQIRAKILNAKPQSKIVTVYGVEIELRQPSLRVVMDIQRQEDRAKAAAGMIAKYAFVPGTDQTVFTEEDVEALIMLPFGKDLSTLQSAITELTDIDVIGSVKNSEETA